MSRGVKTGAALGLSIPLVSFIVGCPGVPPPVGGDGGSTQQVPTGATLVLNTDDNSRHIAQVTMSDGTRIDYWVEREDDGSVAYLSDIRARTTDSLEYYIQFDALQRPTYFEDSTGASVRIHFYLSGNQADVTLTLPNGQSARGIVDLVDLALASPRARVIGSSLSKEQITKDDLAWEVRAQSIRSDGGSLCTVLEDIRRVACDATTLYSIVSLVAAMGTCGLSIGSGGGVASILTGIAGCAGSPAVGQAVAGFVIGEVICEVGRDVIEDGCSPDERRALGESEPPVPPPTTGDVNLGTGSVHVTLSWDNATDVDLHMIDPSGEEIYYAHPTSASGGRLDVDDIDGYGPENIFWPEGGAPNGQYTVAVVYFSSRGRGSSNYDVTVRYTGTGGSQVIREYSGTLTSSGERHTVTTFTVGGGGGSYPESPHPYPNNYNNEWTYTLPGSHASIDVTFDSQTETESCCDFINVMDAAGFEIPGSPFAGRELAGQTVNVPGPTVRIRLTTDWSVTRWGFRVTDVRDGG